MGSFKLMNTAEFKQWLDSQRVTRTIKWVQLHHTYQPSYDDFNGKNHTELQTGMRSYHVNTRGFADIAQNFTIFPDGSIMTGRDLNTAPAGIKGANSNGICIECIGNFDKGGDAMTAKQRESIPAYVKMLIDRFRLTAENNITYHGWWTVGGVNLGDYIPGQSSKTCPGTNFFEGNTRAAYEKNLLPLINNYGVTIKLEKVETVNDIIWELMNAGVITDSALWIKKCEEDINVYWLCYKMANKLRGTL